MKLRRYGFTIKALKQGWGAVSGIPYPLIRLLRTVVSKLETRLKFSPQMFRGTKKKKDSWLVLEESSCKVVKI